MIRKVYPLSNDKLTNSSCHFERSEKSYVSAAWETMHY